MKRRWFSFKRKKEPNDVSLNKPKEEATKAPLNDSLSMTLRSKEDIISQLKAEIEEKDQQLANIKACIDNLNEIILNENIRSSLCEEDVYEGRSAEQLLDYLVEETLKEHDKHKDHDLTEDTGLKFKDRFIICNPKDPSTYPGRLTLYPIDETRVRLLKLDGKEDAIYRLEQVIDIVVSQMETLHSRLNTISSELKSKAELKYRRKIDVSSIIERSNIDADDIKYKVHEIVFIKERLFNMNTVRRMVEVAKVYISK